jgi:hypothetical protein
MYCNLCVPFAKIKHAIVFDVAAVLWFPQAWEDDLQVIVELSYGGLLSHGTPDISSQTTSSSS